MEQYNPKFNGEWIGKHALVSSCELLNILKRVVACDSVFKNEYALGLLIADIAREHGLQVERQKVAEGRDNILVTLGADSAYGTTHGLLFHGHYDTVPYLDMPDPLSARVQNNRLWGRGSVDQKGGLVASLCALIAIKRKGIPLKRSLCLAAVVDEESEHRGSFALSESDIRADYAIVTEPTHLKTVEFGHLGSSPIVIRVEGKTAHASVASEGVNAIEKAMLILERLFKMEFPTVNLGELGVAQGTLCVSMMEAGTAYNNVPHEAFIRMDRRTVPGETSESAVAEIEAVIADAKRVDPSMVATVRIERPDWSWPPIIARGLNPALTPSDTPLFDYLQQAASKAGLLRLEKRFSSCYYDMDFLVNDLKIPTLVYGPGDGRLNHSAAEEIDIDDVARAAEIYSELANKLCIEPC